LGSGLESGFDGLFVSLSLLVLRILVISPFIASAKFPVRGIFRHPISSPSQKARVHSKPRLTIDNLDTSSG